MTVDARAGKPPDPSMSLLAAGLTGVKRIPFERAGSAPNNHGAPRLPGKAMSR